MTDSAIKTAILEKAGEGQIEYAEYSNLILDELVVPDGQLNEADKAFLELFTECKTLSLNSCGLTSVQNLPQIPALIRLELSDNKINLASGSSPIVWPANLVCLKLAGNQLTDLNALIESIKPLQQLTSLDIANNPCSTTTASDKDKDAVDNAPAPTATTNPTETTEAKAVTESEAAAGLPTDSKDPKPEPIGEHALLLRETFPNLKSVDGRDQHGNELESESEEDFSQDGDEDEDEDDDEESEDEDDVDEDELNEDNNEDVNVPEAQKVMQTDQADNKNDTEMIAADAGKDTGEKLVEQQDAGDKVTTTAAENKIADEETTEGGVTNQKQNEDEEPVTKQTTQDQKEPTDKDNTVTEPVVDAV